MFTPAKKWRSDYYPLWSIHSDPDKDREFRKISRKRGDLINEYWVKLLQAPEGEYENVWTEFTSKFNSIENLNLYLEFYQNKIDDLVKKSKEARGE